MTTIYVKPAPDLDPAAAKVLKSDNGVGLLDAMGKVPDAGMPWPNGGITFALLRDRVILRADDPVFDEAAKAKADAAAKEKSDAAAPQAPASTGETASAPAAAPSASSTTPITPAPAAATTASTTATAK